MHFTGFLAGFFPLGRYATLFTISTLIQYFRPENVVCLLRLLIIYSSALQTRFLSWKQTL